jgi:hypothetical protein
VVKGEDHSSSHSALNVTDDNDASLLFVRNDGVVKVGTLAGAGNRPVYANASGELIDAASVGSAGSWTLGGNDIGSNSYFLGTVYDNQHLIIKTNSTPRLKIFGGNSTDNKTYFQFGATYYNTSTSGQGLPSGLTCRVAVDGQVVAKEYLCRVNTWSDFVFAKGYVLPTLEEVENHIKKTGHLEGIPSAREVEEQGINLADMQAKLLQKLEELTLYMIELKKENQQLKKLISNSK